MVGKVGVWREWAGCAGVGASDPGGGSFPMRASPVGPVSESLCASPLVRVFLSVSLEIGGFRSARAAIAPPFGAVAVVEGLGRTDSDRSTRMCRHPSQSPVLGASLAPSISVALSESVNPSQSIRVLRMARSSGSPGPRMQGRGLRAALSESRHPSQSA